MQPIAFRNEEPILVEMKLIGQVNKVYFTDRYEDTYIYDIAVKLNEVISTEKGLDEYLIVNVMKIDDAARFIMLEKSVYAAGNYMSETYHGLFELTRPPIEIEEAITTEVLGITTMNSNATCLKILGVESVVKASSRRTIRLRRWSSLIGRRTK